jgi:hypothetical protein
MISKINLAMGFEVKWDSKFPAKIYDGRLTYAQVIA